MPFSSFLQIGTKHLAMKCKIAELEIQSV